ncbi:GNAT family N-acetyltransferase [Aspergillus saccharolyticus JOP 1030-1]|uniref:GCN5-like N-acetyltransferase n=1 Tax=Aspergillus saccharolyticus JOP 1030-1 TaxID=1450539 RepID=A0A318ZP83_9EURO|nr:GCN5-like N-acetyltransferase [Aspergillus saccharolyticus JOP 1030-1]PYH49399.1 GCN5-like N-acetyltransferase [Aspergillus saccharolyticus JOP 1030-1]
MQITPDPLTKPQTLALLASHTADLRRNNPSARACYVLDTARLQTDPAITVFSAWSDHQQAKELLGIAALKELSPVAGEVKSMRTATSHQRKGVGRALLRFLVEEGRRRGYECLYLETGTRREFAGARALYHGEGFEDCGAFGGYVDVDGENCFMRLRL